MNLSRLNSYFFVGCWIRERKTKEEKILRSAHESKAIMAAYVYLRIDPRAPSSTIGRFTLVLRLRCRRAPAARILRSRSSQRESATRARSPPSPATVTCVNGRLPLQ